MKESPSSTSNATRPPSTFDLIIPTIVTTSTALALFYIYRNYFKRIPTSAHLPHSFLKKRRLYGRVVSVGDADNFRFYHTPGGRWLGWGWLRNVKEGRKELKGQTVWGKKKLGFFLSSLIPIGVQTKRFCFLYFMQIHVRIAGWVNSFLVPIFMFSCIQNICTKQIHWHW